VSISSVGFVALLVAHIVLPFASPFAVGTYASTTGSPRLTSIRASVEVSLEDTTRKAGNPVLNALSRLPGLQSTNDTQSNTYWKGGEYNATFVSQLLFTYASPLVDLASARELYESDAFEVPMSRKSGVRRVTQSLN
jgi:hypothetical protein